MLVTFTTNAYSDITMFGTAAVSLLKLMGQSGNVPGAIMSEDVPEALKRLQEGLQRIATDSADVNAASDDADESEEDEEDAPVGLDKRAGPLVKLLEAAIAKGDNVLWES